MQDETKSLIGVPEGDLAPAGHGSIPPGPEGADVLASLVDPHDSLRRRKIAELRVKWLRTLTEHAQQELESITREESRGPPAQHDGA